ncbi:PREDICTED: uncharacterized protein LOC105596826 isoform X3 [Cercocebus atys]|uniref:uncharacterized protein LOC105596826 isoform X3 n=1 Tax=Cercocebus atys TaxID=9531 RepID=UPI0005F55BF8|nr:PREDICTED: uncharacterized protein LOC105596826 isoform X3 [Cercocebus atys]
MGEEWGRPAGCGASAGGLDDWLQLAGRHVRGGLPSPLLPPPPPFVQRRALRGALVAPARCAPCHRPAVPVSPLGGQGFVRDAVDGYWAERGTHGSIKMWGGWGEQGRVPVWTPLAPGSQGVEGNVSTALQSQQQGLENSSRTETLSDMLLFPQRAGHSRWTVGARCISFYACNELLHSFQTFLPS